MPNYLLELELLGDYLTDMPGFEIWADGALNSSYSISSAGTSISVNINYGGALPSSLQFRFNDALPETGRTINIQSVKINSYVVNQGNFLSASLLSNGGNSNVAVNNSSALLFDESDPALSEFTIGATQTLTAGIDNVRAYNSTSDHTFDMLDGNDYAHLGSGNDKINGGLGNDILRGEAGNDLLFGAAGNDRLFGDEGNDDLYGGNGNDSIQGGIGDDKIIGGDGNDRLNGQADDDIILGGNGDDKVIGGSGEDYLYGGDGDDQIVGGADNDTIDGGSGNDLGYGGLGDDFIDGGDGDDILVGHWGDDVINGGGDDDIILGQQDNDTLNGGDGNDRIYGGLGDDTIDGGADNDFIVGAQIGTVNFDNIETYGNGQDGAGVNTITTGGYSQEGNSWKKISLNYNITADTILEFDFKSTIEAEVSGIGFDIDDDISSNRTFQLYGTQTWGLNAGSYDGSGEWMHFKINVGAFYTGSFDRIIFANDDDGNSPANGTDGNAFWANISIYELILSLAVAVMMKFTAMMAMTLYLMEGGMTLLMAVMELIP